ncbi:MAG: hypothetical protein JWO54_217, partial [Candidatus Saccharibacteria bacterium]|nr:hypothetical protein [Candidatus Saccharibacteria bacterium]
KLIHVQKFSKTEAFCYDINMKKSQTRRSLFTTITASIIGLFFLTLILLLLPLRNLSEVLFFACGALLVILCSVVAIAGKKGMIKDIIHSLTFWT